MMNTGLPLLAEGITRTTFEWGRIQSNADWILPIAACIAILVFVRYLYRRDAVELHPVLGWLLTGLRTATFFGLLILFLQPHWRSEREVVQNSRVLLLVDTSLSMGLTDAESASSVGTVSRARQVVAALSETDFLARLRKVHDVSVFQFSDDLKRDRVVTLGKATPAEVSCRKRLQSPIGKWKSRGSATGVASHIAGARLGQAARAHRRRNAARSILASVDSG